MDGVYVFVNGWMGGWVDAPESSGTSVVGPEYTRHTAPHRIISWFWDCRCGGQRCTSVLMVWWVGGLGGRGRMGLGELLWINCGEF